MTTNQENWHWFRQPTDFKLSSLKAQLNQLISEPAHVCWWLVRFPSLSSGISALPPPFHTGTWKGREPLKLVHTAKWS